MDIRIEPLSGGLPEFLRLKLFDAGGLGFGLLLCELTALADERTNAEALLRSLYLSSEPLPELALRIGVQVYGNREYMWTARAARLAAQHDMISPKWLYMFAAELLQL